MIKRLAHRLALRAETLLDPIFGRSGPGRHIDPFIGFATPEGVVLRGRVLSKLRHAKAGKGQSRLDNLRDMIGMFLTDEVRDATVSYGDLTARSDEEGYFTLMLPHDGKTGWQSAALTVEGSTEIFDCPYFVPPADASFMVVSDIDDTMMLTGAYSLTRNLWTSLTGNALSRIIFPDAKQLMETLSDGARNPVYYVSSSPWNLHNFLGNVFNNAGLVRGPMFLRDLGISETKFITEGHGGHKGGSIDQILRASPDLPVILLGDTGQHDAHIYLEAINRHPGRILAVGLRIPENGIDAADQRDLDALEQSEVPTFAAHDFSGFVELMRKAYPDLMERPTPPH